jgi:predicted helicase
MNHRQQRFELGLEQVLDRAQDGSLTDEGVHVLDPFTGRAHASSVS